MNPAQIDSDAQAQILIVEDSPLEAEMLRRCLNKAGYRTSVAKNGEEGLQVARALHVALVVSDVNMPVMDGYELCRRIKYDEMLWNIPVILLTSLSEPENIIQAINAGTDSYITKPFVEANLLECVKSLLATPIRWRRAKEQRIEVVEYNGKRCAISGSGQQILSLMLSVYGNSLAQNQDLMHIQRQLNLLNDNLNEQVRARTAELRQVLEATVMAVSLTLERRDTYDTERQHRVDKLSAAIATEMGHSPDQLESLKRRTQTGLEIAKDISLPWLVAQMLLQHHDSVDGFIYPQGLKNEQAMLEARILAVADKLEAMMAFRPYRAAPGMDAAIRTLTQGRGTRFDPAVVDACLRVVNKPGYEATAS
jgi:response regulator RpfG family c-di-GMP phosphodiesterase